MKESLIQLEFCLALDFDILPYEEKIFLFLFVKNAWSFLLPF